MEELSCDSSNNSLKGRIAINGTKKIELR
jgi:hypothetical protein